MSFLDALRHRLRPLLRRGEFDREMDEEFRHHLDLSAQEFPEGQSRFGSPGYYQEETRRMTPLGWLDPLSHDLRYALRNLRRAPAFTAVAVLSLAIGIGANSAIFSLTYSILLRPLPLAHPEQLVDVQRASPDLPNDVFSYATYRSLRQSRGFASVTALGGAAYVPIAAGTARDVVGVDAVDGNFFETIGLRPAMGRFITADDERSRTPVVVISDALWLELFNRATAAIGSTITMRGTAFTVVGVAPKVFQGLEYPGRFDTAVPLSTLALVGGDPAEEAGANTPTLQIIGRLAHPSAAAAVATMMNAAYRSCCASGADSSGIRLTNIERGISFAKFDVQATYGRLLLVLLGGAATVLLAACANLGTLLLARGSARERELAVRLSLGASRRRLAAQMLVENALLAALGAVAGLAMAHWALGLIAHRLPGSIADRSGLELTWQVLGFTAAVAGGSVLIFGGLPTWRATRRDLIAPLKDGAPASARRGTGWMDRGVVVAQVALALILVNGAGLFVATLRNLRSVNGGFATEGTVSAELDSRGTSYEHSGLAPVADRLIAHAARLPGVRAAALSLAVPVFGGRSIRSTVAVEGYSPAPDERMQQWLAPVTPGFFATLGISLRLGRDFTPDDRATAQPVAVVNDAFVHQYIRDGNPLGTTVRSVVLGDTSVLQIVGVAGDARYVDLREPAQPMIFVPLAQFERIPTIGQLPVLALTVRTSGDDHAVASSLRNAVLTEAPDARLYGPERIEASMDEALNRETLTAELATLFGAVALVLAGIGLYGVVSYHVARRTREIGVRMALGAAPAAVVWMVLRQALVLVMIGVLAGIPLALGGGKAIAAELFGLGRDPLFLAGAGVLLIGVAVAASALPARRAAHVDPLIALRAD